jgi:RNA polymerase sigma factor (sigma-70 family)
MFPTTRRSIVLALASPEEEERVRAFDTLVALYWKPVYKYVRLSRRRSPEDAEDLTSSFFARAFEKESLASYDPARASFHGFLRMLLDRHASNEEKHARRQKRGGGETRLDFDAAEAELARDGSSAAAAADPEELFHREWVKSAFALAVDRLRKACDESGRASSRDFALFEAYDLDPAPGVSYRSLAEKFSMPETNVTNRLAAVRRRFREIVLDTLREATASEREFKAEARALLGVEVEP